MTDELRERVARAIYEGKRARLLEAFGDTGGWPEWETLKPTLQEIQREECDPFIALIRNEVLEEAAGGGGRQRTSVSGHGRNENRGTMRCHSHRHPRAEGEQRMIIKETEALEFNCHYPDTTHCSGARCMAWRWAYDKVLRTTDDPDAPVLEWFENVQSATHGYCGLAGRP